MVHGLAEYHRVVCVCVYRVRACFRSGGGMREREREIFFLSKYFPPPFFFVFNEKDLKMKREICRVYDRTLFICIVKFSLAKLFFFFYI